MAEREVSEWVINLKGRQYELAVKLYELVYGEGITFHEVEPEIQENYRKDAWDVLMRMPHLMDLEMRENMAALGLLKEED